MPRRLNDCSSDDDPPKKKNCPPTSSFSLRHGEFLTDIAGKQWKLGKAVGVGGFGEIYLASDDLTCEAKTDSKYVAKVESHKNGPLFVEVNCYLRVARQAMIDEWKDERKMRVLGMPHYVASGSHVHKGERYRFLILPKFASDLEKILQDKKILNLKTVLTISLQIIDVLEYIHSKGYIHSDVKASNMMLNDTKSSKVSRVSKRLTKYVVGNPVRACRVLKTRRNIRNLRPQPNVNYVDDIPHFQKILLANATDTTSNDFESSQSTKDQVYLLDYGLACKFLTSNGEHKPFCVDERKAHAGTILFCSRDAHKGVPSRRSDLESLGYNIIYWLTGNLPWSSEVDDPEIVHKKKQKAMNDVEYFLKSCFSEYPMFLEEYFKYLQNLHFQDKPDYNYCKELFKQSLRSNNYKDDSRFDFDNTQSKVNPVKIKRVSENFKIRKFIHCVSRPPLQSNIPVKPQLRKKVKNKIKKNNWFEELTDPEIILKQARERKNTENNETNIADLDIYSLNPTYAMIEVYTKCRERIDTPSNKGDSCLEHIEGYTHAMMCVLQKMNTRKEAEYEDLAVNLNKGGKIRKCVNKHRKKFESPAKSPPQTRMSCSKSAIVMLKKENVQLRKVKNASPRRTYSLRG